MACDVKAAIADEAKRIVGGERRAAYGTPERNFGRIARLWSVYLDLQRETRGDATIRPLDVAAMMRLMKEARLVESPGHRDSFVDLVGYSLCGAELSVVSETVDEVNPETRTVPNGRTLKVGDLVNHAVEDPSVDPGVIREFEGDRVYVNWENGPGQFGWHAHELRLVDPVTREWAEKPPSAPPTPEAKAEPAAPRELAVGDLVNLKRGDPGYNPGTIRRIEDRKVFVKWEKQDSDSPSPWNLTDLRRVDPLTRGWAE